MGTFMCGCVCTLPSKETAHNDSRPLGSSLISQPPQLMSPKGSGVSICGEGIYQHTQEGRHRWTNWKLYTCIQACTRTHTHTHTHKLYTHLSPGVHVFVPPVSEPSPATDTGGHLFVFGVEGGEVNGIGPSLQTQSQQSLQLDKN